jgi:hypothetical protein
MAEAKRVFHRFEQVVQLMNDARRFMHEHDVAHRREYYRGLPLWALKESSAEGHEIEDALEVVVDMDWDDPMVPFRTDEYRVKVQTVLKELDAEIDRQTISESDESAVPDTSQHDFYDWLAGEQQPASEIWLPGIGDDAIEDQPGASEMGEGFHVHPC